jgi:hypothetical protein
MVYADLYITLRCPVIKETALFFNDYAEEILVEGYVNAPEVHHMDKNFVITGCLQKVKQEDEETYLYFPSRCI